MKKEIETPWGEIGYITYKRTYARKIHPDRPETEEFHQTIDRVLNACEEQLNVGFSKKENEELRGMLLNLKGSVAGRFLWQLGTSTVDKLGLPSLQNCAGVIVNEPIRPFTWTMELLMLGAGVGYNIQREHVYSLPKVGNKINIVRKDDASADFIVPDTREGWVKLLGKVLKAHFYGNEDFSYSTVLIRGKGAPIKGFGGTSSGPEVLCDGIDQIHKILNSRSNKKLRPIDCLDIMNIIGSVVVAGNVRRSAQIALGDPDDIEFLKAKRWDLGSIPNWRSMSNNSIVTDSINNLPEEFWETYKQGEPYGLINIQLSKKIGRLGETQYPDPGVEVYNPCAEQSLENHETCCLAEIFLSNISSKKELFKIAKYLYRINKHSLALPCSLKETEEIVHKNMRMGIGVTGTFQATEEQRSWLSECYIMLRKYDIEYSKLHNWNPSIKLTTSKPSGTLSLLKGVTPGANVNPAGPWYIRRVRISSDSPLIKACEDSGYKVEFQRNFDKTLDYTTKVVEFPCSVPLHTPVAKTTSAIEQLEMIKWVQANWSDNSVSVTVNYKKEELSEIKKWLSNNYKDCIKTVSFLLTNDHGFDQAPYEDISEEEYLKMIKNTKPIVKVSVAESDISEDQIGCSSGACPVK